LAGLKDVKIGAQVGTTSYTSATDQIKPSEQIAVYNTNDDAKQALSNGQIGALIVDLPTAFEITGAEEIKNSVIVGQVTTSGTPDEFGMVLDKGSSLTSCVSWAIEQLYEDATLMNLKQQWLSSTGNAPEFK
jgi:polar amino acid transport system substrate-binding protein